METTAHNEPHEERDGSATNDTAQTTAAGAEGSDAREERVRLLQAGGPRCGVLPERTTQATLHGTGLATRNPIISQRRTPLFMNQRKLATFGGREEGYLFRHISVHRH